MIRRVLNLGSPINWAHSLNRGLVSHWTGLPNSYGGGTLFDIAGSNHGTLTNFARTGNTSNWVPGRLPGRYCLDFDGVNDYVNVADSNSLDLTNAVTITGWALDRDTSGLAILAAKSTTGSLDGACWYGWDRDGTGIRWVTSSSANGTQELNATVPSSGVWHQFAATFDDPTDTMRLFVNGNQVAVSTTKTKDMTANARALVIGGESPTPVFVLNGLIDDVRIYNRALSAGEVWQLYEESLLGYPRMFNWFYMPLGVGAEESSSSSSSSASTSSSSSSSVLEASGLPIGQGLSSSSLLFRMFR